jgi:hypothetical protein
MFWCAYFVYHFHTMAVFPAVWFLPVFWLFVFIVAGALMFFFVSLAGGI